MYSFYDVYHYTCQILGDRVTILTLVILYFNLNLTLILTPALILILTLSLIQTLIQTLI